MIFRRSTTNTRQTMKSNKIPSGNVGDNSIIGLPVLRKSISEPGIPAAEINRVASRNKSHSATPRIVITVDSAPRRHSVLEPADASQLARSGFHQLPGASNSPRSIDMINARNFPAAMTKHFLRRRAHTVDVHIRDGSACAEQNGGPHITNAKYGLSVPAGPGANQGRKNRGILKSGDHSLSRIGRQQAADGQRTWYDANISLPAASRRTLDGSLVSAGYPTNNSDLQGGRSSVGSWQTYPLSSRPIHNHRGSHVFRASGDQKLVHPHGSFPGHDFNLNTSSRMQTRIVTSGLPPHPHHSTHADDGLDKSDPDHREQLRNDQKTTVIVGKPTVDLLQGKRSLANGHRRGSAGNVEESGVSDGEADNLNVRVRHWLSSLDSTLCQRYARRQMASLREYETPNYNT